MAQVTKIEIRNFKGIESATLALEDEKPAGRFITLIGLNESGKTTLLEAISHSVLADPTTSNLMESVQGTPEINDLIPKGKKAAFTGIISVKTYVTLSDSDVERIKEFVKANHNLIVLGSLEKNITLDRSYQFEDSSFQTKPTHLWSFKAKVKKKGGSKTYDLTSTGLKSEWLSTIGFLRSILPQIIYFPTFLVDFPSRIYLEGRYGNVDKYYRTVVNDALCSLSPGLNIKKHIIERVEKHRTKTGPFSSALRASPEGQQIDATIQALSAKLNYVIFGAWSDIFGKKITGRRINVEWHIDETTGRHIYLEITIVGENNQKFYIAERSLGFRWFFSFLLFTQFQAFRSERDKAVFLFDEPASHLHARAQQRLLESFKKIAEPHHLIVYSTHSHYLVNPLWLEKAYIVTNGVLNPDSDDYEDELTDRSPTIKLTKYRQFVSENPSKTTYFQPVLDALDYAVAPLQICGPAILLEGKFDYFPFQYLRKRLDKEDGPNVFPANGAGAMEGLISLHRGLGLPFVIVLDDDAAGRKEKQRYIDEFLLSDDQVVTLDDLLPSLAGKEFEGIFGQDVIDLIQAKIGSNPKKQDFYLFFQEVMAKDDISIIIDETLQTFTGMYAQLEEKLSNQ